MRFYNVCASARDGRCAVLTSQILTGNIYDEVDAVEDGAGKFFLVADDLIGVAGAFFVRVAEITAGAWVHSGNEYKLCGIFDGSGGTGNGDLFFFEGLTKCFQMGARELGDFVQEERAAVREGDFAGAK